MSHWLFKTEPDVYSIDDLIAEPTGIGRWDGIRNYQARNLLRDRVKAGDRVLIYHSSCRVPGIAGLAEVVGDTYPDPSQFDSTSPWHDPKATADLPRWYCVDIRAVRKFSALIPLTVIRQEAALADMVLLRQGRLSVQPVSAREWRQILKLAPAAD